MQHPDYPLWSFLGMVLILLPLPWQWRARNVATLALIFWVFLENLVVFVNTLVWADNFANIAPIWCDISARILLAIPFAVPACSLAQMRRLESVASTRRTVISASERRRRMWGEGIQCIGFPLVMLALAYVFQGHRYDITESKGPSIPVYFSWPGLFLRFFIPIAMSIASLLFAGLAVRWFLVRRLEFRAILASSNSGLSISRYLRLIALAIVDSLILVTNDTIALVTSFVVFGRPRAYHWSEVHSEFGQISQIVEGTLSPTSYFASNFGLYIGPLYSLVFFIFFGLGEEAITVYVKFGWEVAGWLKPFGIHIRHQKQTSEIHMVPSLGSKVISASGGPWTSDIDSDPSRAGNEDKGEKIFESFGGDTENNEPITGGIPVLVERSVV